MKNDYQARGLENLRRYANVHRRDLPKLYPHHIFCILLGRRLYKRLGDLDNSILCMGLCSWFSPKMYNPALNSDSASLRRLFWRYAS